MNCVKCGAPIEKSDCSLLTCANDLDIKMVQCGCEVCHCHHRTPNKVCNKCARGDHRGKL